MEQKIQNTFEDLSTQFLSIVCHFENLSMYIKKSEVSERF